MYIKLYNIMPNCILNQLSQYAQCIRVHSSRTILFIIITNFYLYGSCKVVYHCDLNLHFLITDDIVIILHAYWTFGFFACAIPIPFLTISHYIYVYFFLLIYNELNVLCVLMF